jgi:geranylgeranyl reductase family protein
MAPNLHQRENAQDVAVVGGGPSGSFTALNLARAGARVTVFEEHGAIGAPSHCAGHLSIRSLKNLGLYPLSESILENTFSQANFYSPSGFKFSVRLAKPVTCAINREAFDRFIAQKAEAAGASYHLNSLVQTLLMENHFVKGVKVKRSEGPEAIFPAKIVVDAEGISSRLLRQAGLSTHNRDKFVYAVEAEVENIKEVELNAVDVFLGRTFAPGFYAWLIPRRDGTAKIGLATRRGNPKDFLERLISKHPAASKKLGKAKLTRLSFHSISLGGAIPKAFSNGFIAVGDAASQVKPTTGGGVIFGLKCAQIAAQVALEALNKDDVSSNLLEMYQQRCGRVLDFDFKVMLRIRRFLDSLSDEKIDEVLRFCTKIGLAKTLEDIEEIDFQGQTFLKILTKPSAYAFLTYFVLLYLSAHP